MPPRMVILFCFHLQSNLGDIVTSTNDVSDVNILSPFLLAPANRKYITDPVRVKKLKGTASEKHK